MTRNNPVVFLDSGSRRRSNYSMIQKDNLLLPMPVPTQNILNLSDNIDP